MANAICWVLVHNRRSPRGNNEKVSLDLIWRDRTRVHVGANGPNTSISQSKETDMHLVLMLNPLLYVVPRIMWRSSYQTSAYVGRCIARRILFVDERRYSNGIIVREYIMNRRFVISYTSESEQSYLSSVSALGTNSRL
jgi:hypothetical protein